LKRSELREKTFIILFQQEFDDAFSENIDFYLEREGLKKRYAVYARQTLLRIVENIRAIDETIRSHLVNWDFDRLSKVDLSVLRLAVYEMKYSDDVPGKVAINEAIELAKKYNDEKAGIFVNGLLDRVYKSTNGVEKNDDER
jgi:N utilization substance protein B